MNRWLASASLMQETINASRLSKRDKKMSESNTWLPRFTEEELYKVGLSLAGSRSAADFVNRRLEEFEKSCRKWYCPKDMLWSPEPSSNDAFESLMLPPRPIKRGVSKAEIIDALRGRVQSGSLTNIQGVIQTHIALAERIEREGIVE